MSPNLRALVAALASPVVAQRREAEAALLAVGPAAVEVLLPALEDTTRDLRTAAALVLGRLGAPEALEPLAAALARETVASARPLLLRGLCDLAHPTASPAVRAQLIRSLSDPDLFCRALACAALGKIGGATAYAALELIAAADPEGQVRAAAKQALLSRYAALEQVPGPQATPPNSLAAANAGSLMRTDPIAEGVHALRAGHAGGLGGAKEKLVRAGESALGALAPLLYADHDGTRLAALEVLGRIGGERATQVLAAFLRDADLGGSLRAATLYALGRAAQPLAATARWEGSEHAPNRGATSGLAPLLRTHLRDPDAFVRAATVDALVRWGGAERAAGVAALFDDEDAWVQQAGLSALAEVITPADRRLRDRMLDGLTRVVEARNLLALLAAFDKMLRPADPTDAKLIGPLSYFLDHERGPIRQTALALSLRLAPQLEPQLLARVRAEASVEPDAEFELARALKERLAQGEGAALPLLDLFAASPMPEVRELAYAGLARIGSLASLERLCRAANGQEHAAQRILAQLPADGVVTAVTDSAGLWHPQLQPRCGCGQRLVWQTRARRQELWCEACKREYVLAHGARLLAVDLAPYGVCLCCERKYPLIRGGANGHTLVCPESETVHIRPHDAPNHLLRLGDLPFGACSCCREPQPLVRTADGVVCRRTRERHVPDGSGGYALAARAAAAQDIRAINEALLAGTLDIGQSGLPQAADAAPQGDDE